MSCEPRFPSSRRRRLLCVRRPGRFLLSRSPPRRRHAQRKHENKEEESRRRASNISGPAWWRVISRGTHDRQRTNQTTGPPGQHPRRGVGCRVVVVIGIVTKEEQAGGTFSLAHNSGRPNASNGGILIQDAARERADRSRDGRSRR